MVSKLEILQRFYQIYLDQESEYFKYQGRLYYFNRVSSFASYYPFYLQILGLKGFQVVNNCFNHPISMQHVLYTYQIEDYKLNNFINLSLQPVNKTVEITKIKQSWCMILDQAKGKLGNYASRLSHFEHFIILFYYYQALGESAIRILNLINEDSLMMGVEHFCFNDCYEDLCNPNNLVFASRLKDLSSSYQKGIITIEQLDDYIKSASLTIDELIYLYARLLFPSEFMHLALNEDCNDLNTKQKLLTLYQNIDRQRDLLVMASHLLNQYVKLPELTWLEY
ncbi:MAG: hypothetical protein ACLRT4_04890 [Thomasclavelia sp.]